MSDVAMSWARDENNNLILAVNAERGKRYKCFGCDDVDVYVVNGDLVTPHMRAARGSVHTGSLCRHLNNRRSGSNSPHIDLVNRNNLAKNIMRAQDNRTPEKDFQRHPTKPKKEPECLTICTSLQKIQEFNLHQKPDFELENGEMLSQTVVSMRNSYLIMNDNRSLGIRGLQVVPDYAFKNRRTIRFLQKARRFENHHRTAAQKVFDMKFETEEQFLIAFDMLFIENPDRSSRRKYLPKYKEALIFGIWQEVLPDCCHGDGECKKVCDSEWVHCTGRQVSRGVNALRQINVDNADLIIDL